MLARVYANAGRRPDAQAILTRLGQKPSARDAYELALLHLKLGNVEAGLTWLQAACRERSPQFAFIEFNKKGSDFTLIRDDPRFQDILRCAGLRPY
jgi:hypothetical protein